jgi:diketogulonate reductase-like aldo/keto reductase
LSVTPAQAGAQSSVNQFERPDAMKTVSLPDQSKVPALGLGTWRMGESASSRKAEIVAIRSAITIGYRLFDTAEMYGEGGAEEVLGQAIADAVRAADIKREDVFIVSKVYPHNASRTGVQAACDRSRKRLQLDSINLYLLHWRGQHPLAQTVAGFEDLCSKGRIHRWGVSNFDTADMQELAALPDGAQCAANQVYFSLSERGAQFDLLPWLQARTMPLMAYCPIDQGRIASDATLARIGAAHQASAAQIALAWVLSHQGVIAIPKAAREAHLRENFTAAELALSEADFVALDAQFAPPIKKVRLAIT